MPINTSMSYRIRCYTLFDITRTGVTSRSKPADDVGTWLAQRNSQCNFDTIIQIISLRSQPDITEYPKKIQTNNLNYFGVEYQNKIQTCWVFDFDIQHPSVFDDGIDELGSLYSDCNGVPMVLCGTEDVMTTSFLDTTMQLKNIHFERV